MTVSEIITIIASLAGAFLGGALSAWFTMTRKVKNGSIIQKREVYSVVSKLLAQATSISELSCLNLDGDFLLYANDEIKSLFARTNDETIDLNKLKENVYRIMKKELKA